MKKERRSMQDRRTGKERRKSISFRRFFFSDTDRREAPDRRSEDERRSGWIRFSKWSSVYLPKLKIAKFLRLSK